MKKLLPIFIFSTFAVQSMANEPDIDAAYFHPAASLYIQGDLNQASNIVARGLSEFPDDAKLKKLEELLKKQQEQQNNQDQDQNQDQQDQNQDQQDQNQDQQDKNQDQNQDQQQNDQNQSDESQQDTRNAGSDQQSQPQRAEEMSADEAQQLMDAMKQEEKNERLRLHPVLGAPVRVDKDW